MKSPIPFDPNAFDTYLTIEELILKFDFLKEMDFTKISLKEELVNLNYEIISPEYEDKAFENIEEYYYLEVDEIV